VLGNADRDLATAIDEVFAVAKEKGFVVDSVNQAHTLAQGRDPNLPDASHNALTQEITGESAAFAELAKRIFESASLSADPIIEDLKKKLGEESKEFKNKFVPVRFEFLYFFIHLANRSAFAQLGAEKSEKLSSQLVEHLIDTTVEILMGHWPEHLKQGIKKDSYNNYNVAESDYAKCKAIFLMPEDDTKTEDRIATGEKSKSMIGQLVDNVSEIITGKVNISLLFPLQILESIGGMLEKKKDIDALIPKAAAAELECGQRLSALLKDVHDRVGEAPVLVNAENGEVFVHPELGAELEKSGNEGLSDMLRAGACANPPRPDQC
jgi:hypothetical protein